MRTIAERLAARHLPTDGDLIELRDEAVQVLIEQADEVTRLTSALQTLTEEREAERLFRERFEEAIGDALDGQFPHENPSIAREVQQQREALDATKAYVSELTAALLTIYCLKYSGGSVEHEFVLKADLDALLLPLPDLEKGKA